VRAWEAKGTERYIHVTTRTKKYPGRRGAQSVLPVLLHILRDDIESKRRNRLTGKKSVPCKRKIRYPFQPEGENFSRKTAAGYAPTFRA
jgi:hypothetical protein